MRHTLCVVLLLASWVRAQAPTSQPASTLTLRSGELTAAIHLPDAANGHYRGSRFDWSGMVGELRLGNDSFWNEWNPSPNAQADHDNAVGPAMEFGMNAPIGYDDAAVGGGFVKIGVGVLERASTKPYFFRENYRVIDPGVWRILPDAAGREVTFIHSVRLGEIAYVYQKRVAVGEDNSLSIQCRLWNTGSKPFSTIVYAHNFYRLADQGWEPGMQIRFDRAVQSADDAKPRGLVATIEKGFSIEGAVKKGGSVWLPLKRTDAGLPRAYSLTRDPLRMDVTLDFDPSRVVIYGLPEAVCVEPFKDINLEPGADTQWEYRHQFSRRPHGGD